MHLLDFINTNENWENLLSKEPYNLKIKKDGDYILFKYDQLNSDFSLTEVQEARGSIFIKEGFNRKFKYACRPFTKFFNYGEEKAADIDWNNCWVSEKIDGSLMKMWYHNGWHLSTNSTIDAFKAFVDGTDLTFGNVFERILTAPIEKLGTFLNKNFTYLFEMTSLETRVVIPYDDRIYFLTSFNTETGQESTFINDELLLKRAKRFKVNNLDTLINMASNLDKDHEGFVVADIHGNRIKVKGEEYLIASHLINNHRITKKRILTYILDEKIDDFLAYCPQYKNFVEEVKTNLCNYCGYLENLKNMAEPFMSGSRNFYAFMIKDYPEKDFLFKCYNNRDLFSLDYVKNMPIKKLLLKIYKE